MAFAEPHPGLCCSLPSPWDTAWHGGAILDSLSGRLLEAPCCLGSARGPRITGSCGEGGGAGILAFTRTRVQQNLSGRQWTLRSPLVSLLFLSAVASMFGSSVYPVGRPPSQGTPSFSPGSTSSPPTPTPRHMGNVRQAPSQHSAGAGPGPFSPWRSVVPVTPVSHTCKQASKSLNPGQPCLPQMPNPQPVFSIQRSGSCSFIYSLFLKTGYHVAQVSLSLTM